MKMKMSFAYSASTLTALLVFGVPAAIAQSAGDYPSRPIRMIVPFPAGGSADTLARIAGQKLTESWGQQVVVDNRSGAGGNIGADVLVKSAPDGYTIMMGTVALAISAGLYSKLPFDVKKDFAPVSLVATVPMILITHPSVPVKSVKELIAFAKANPGKLTYSSAGNGTPSHLAGALFEKLTGAKLVHIPYKGGAPAVIDLIGGQISLMLDNSLSVPSHIKAGKLRALGVSTKSRSSLLPDVPTIIEAGVPGYEFDSWFGIFAPGSTPQALVAKLSDEVGRIVAMRDVQEKLRSQGAEPVGNKPGEFAQFFNADVEKLTKLIAEVGARID
jgi:tripartite-type tricarboxylate transporter receptor subunit TctC